MWFWILVTVAYIFIGILFAIAYVANHSDVRVRLAKEMPLEMSIVEPIFVFLFWPLVIVIKMIAKVIA